MPGELTQLSPSGEVTEVDASSDTAIAVIAYKHRKGLMRKLIIIAASLAALLAVTATAAIAAPGVTTHTVTLNAATDGVVDLPALNSQFTSMTINVNDGTAYWGAAELGYWTSYQDGVATTGVVMTSGIWGDPTEPGHGPLLLEGAQVGAVIYRVDGGEWHEVTAPAATITETHGGTHHVQVAYNDRPGSYDDNFGSLSLTVVRTKA